MSGSGLGDGANLTYAIGYAHHEGGPDVLFANDMYFAMLELN